MCCSVWFARGVIAVVVAIVAVAVGVIIVIAKVQDKHIVAMLYHEVIHPVHSPRPEKAVTISRTAVQVRCRCQSQATRANV